ncbi:MAG: hypothetical protein Q7R88_00080 [bacterium]|nr:hypothetical protein [bacterium]
MKTFQHNGKWTEKATPTVVLLCACGNKYIKTRLEQTVCIRCIAKRAGR